MDILLEGPIGNEPGEISAAFIKSQLTKAAGQPVVARIHSQGGSVFEGFAIYDAFKAYPGNKKCVIESAAFSIASIVAMAFPIREITENGYVMIHNPSMDDGEEEPPIIEQLRRRMVDIYAAACSSSAGAISTMMKQETFLDAEQSKSMGFVTAIAPATVRAVARHKLLVASNRSFNSCIVARTGNPALQWKTAVASAKASGLSTAKAVAMVEANYPGLRMKMIQQANRR